MRQTLTACVLLFTASALHAATPDLKTIRPPGAQRGAEVELTLSGARLGDAQEILYYQTGLTTSKLEKVNDNQIKATIKIAPDCPLGLHDLRLRTASGVSELRTFSVGALPEIKEVEPNNEFAAPQAIAMNSVVNGVAENEDVDYYAVTAKKGERITAEVEGIRL
ncbi:MAG: peptidase, partial [Isosphaeraceae bacterium]